MASYNGPTPSEYGATEVNELGHQFNLLRGFSGEDVGVAGIPIVRGRSEEGATEGIPIATSYDQQLLLCPTPIPSRTQRPMFSGDAASSGIGPSGVQPPLSRRPYLFSVPQNSSLLSSMTGDQHQLQFPYDRMHREQNMAIRYRLFNRLDPGGSHLRMPSHVIPAIFFSVLPFDDFKDPEGKQSSLVTIFSIWNTMMGTSLLTIPWAIHQAGFLLGLFLMLLMAALAFYTAYRVVESPNSLALDRTDADFSDVCRFFWGKKGEYFSVFFSVLVLVGGVILYFVLMSNFLYYTGNIVNEALQPNSSIIPVIVNGTLSCDVFCPERIEQHHEVHDLLKFGERLLFGERDLPLLSQHDEHLSLFQRIWTLQGGVPLILAICLFPLLNFKSPTFFMNFNGLGTISIGYLMCFTISKAIECKFNVNFFDRTSEHFVQLFNWKFPALSGTLALAFFIHNAILTILRNQKHPENNSRDLFIGYSLSAFCYVLIGSLFFLAFPTFRECISDNFLNNFATGDVLSAVARIFLLFQMLTVLPLLMYLIRVQFSYVLVGTVYPGLSYVVLINLAVLLVALSFALFYPHVGAILRYIGSISGLVWMFLLPCGVHMKRLQVQGRLTHWQIGLHSFLILCGVLNLIAQFFL